MSPKEIAQILYEIPETEFEKSFPICSEILRLKLRGSKKSD